MAEAATTTPVSPEVQQTAARLGVAAQTMARGLAKTGSPLYSPEVQNFQRAYNEMVRVFGQVPRGGASSCKPGVALASLVEDGQYGGFTSAALQAAFQAVMRSPPPCKAVDFPVWYAQNADLIDTWTPRDNVSDAVEITGPSAAANTQLTAAKTEQSAAAISAKDDGGANTQTIQQTTQAQPAGTAVTTKPAAVASLCTAWGGSAGKRCKKLGFNKFVKGELAAGRGVYLAPDKVKRTIERRVNPAASLCDMFTNKKNRAQCKTAGFEAYIRARLLQGDAFNLTWTPAGHGITPASPQHAETHVDVDEPAHVVVAPQHASVPVLAIGIGVLALGGLLWWFTTPSRRHA